MSIATTRAAIKSKLESVATVRNVDDYAIWTDDWDYILANWTDSEGRIHRWNVALAAPIEVPRPMARDLNIWNYSFSITGIYSLLTSDETSKTFEDIVEDVLIAFSGSNSIAEGALITSVVCNAIEASVHPATETPVHRCVISVGIKETRAATLSCST